MIQLKNPDIFLDLVKHPIHEKMKDLITWLAWRYPGIVITCAYEDRKTPSVHSVVPLRGIDIRSWSLAIPKQVVAEINMSWLYDHTRPSKRCAILHDSGRGRHIHLQVHDRTQFKETKNEKTELEKIW